MRRIIVTGSRGWSDVDAVHSALSAMWALYGGPYECVTVHGDCPYGADAIADRWCAKVGAPIEKHPANWQLHGKSAGFRRNTEMAALGAAVCLAFWDGKSPGTLHMIRSAVEQEIPVRVVPARRSLGKAGAE